MSEILLGQSYFLRFDPKLWRACQPYAPLGTLYAASYLRQHGYAVALFDAMLAESEADWQAALAREKPTVAVIYDDSFNYLSKMCLLRMRHAALTMIDLARGRGCRVVVAGADATDHAALYLRRGADAVITGEGELTLAEVVGALTGRASTDLSSIAGLAWLDRATDRVSYSPRRLALRDLDALPWPAWDLVDIERYRRIWRQQHGYFSMNVATSRGCPFHCNWCAKPIWGQHYYTRSPESVAAELAWLKATYQPEHIWFVDDIFGLKPGWLSSLADQLEARHLRIPFKCLQRADLLLKADTVAALARLGADTVWIGAESGSQRILDAMEKGTRVEQIREAARRLQGAGIRVGFFLQFGYLGETLDDIELTIQLVRDCHPDDVGISVSYPLPGTPFYRQVQDQLGPRANWLDSSDLAMLYQGPYSTAFYRALHHLVHQEFRLSRFRQGTTTALARPRPSLVRRIRQSGRYVVDRLTLPLIRSRVRKLARPTVLSRAASDHSAVFQPLGGNSSD